VTVAALAGQQYDLADVRGTPPVGANVTDDDPAYYIGSNPSIDIEKYVSVDGGTNWLDADTAGAAPYAAVGSDVKFYVVVNNTGNVELTNIVVGDTDFTFTGVASTLAAGASDTSNIVTVAALAGQQYDLADVRGTPPVGANVTDDDPAYYFGVKAKIVISPLNVTNWINDSHNLTACVYIDIGSGWVLYTEPITINFAKTAGVGSLSATSVPTSTGCAQTTLTTTTVGTSTVTARCAFSVDGAAFDVSTDSTGDNSAPAQKTWVDARISIVESGTNPVNTAHNFTVTVEKNDGINGGWVAAVGVNVTPSLVAGSVGWITSSGPYITNASGQVVVTVNSAVAGTATVQASATVNVLGVDIAVATDGYGAYIVHNVKTWIQEQLVCHNETAWAYSGSWENGGATVPGKVYQNDDIVRAAKWGWTNKISTNGTYVWDFWASAGQNILANGVKVGTITVVAAANGCVTVTYNMTEGNILTEAHLWVGPTKLPLVKQGRRMLPTASPGLFPYSPVIAPDGLSATWSGCGFTYPFYVAVHGVAMWCEPQL
jgi:hypothetical protein